MKDLYLALLIILMLMMFCFLWLVRRKGGVYKNNIRNLLVAALLGSGFYCIFLKTNHYEVAMFMDGLYILMYDILSYFMLGFIQSYTESKIKNRRYRIGVLCLFVADCLLILTNNVTQWCFVLEKRVYQGEIVYYTEHFRMAIAVHFILCYMLMAYGFFLLMWKMIYSINIYRKKYILIFLPLLIFIILNAFCYTQSLPFDFSVSMYSVLSAVVYISIYAILPNSIINSAQSYITENVNQGVFCYERNGRCIFANRIIRESVEWEQESAKEKINHYFFRIHKEMQQQGKDKYQWQEKLVTSEAEKYIYCTYQTIYSQKEKKVVGFFILCEDRTQEISTRKKEKYRLEHDLLTGLYNREYFFKCANERIQSNPGEKKWMLVSDIKDFKLINNIYGHNFGDEILKMQAKLIQTSLKEDTICARISGDKFVMLICREEFDRAIFEKAVEEIRNFVAQKKYHLTYHIGYYDITGKNEDAEKLYNDVNLAIAKIHNDYNRIFVECDQSITDKMLREKNLIAQFDDALETNQFKMFLQPQVSSVTQKTIGAEALVRWIHPEEGMIFPDMFIDVFERAGIIQKLDRAIWEIAAKKLAEWKSKGIEDMHISVNISTKDFYYLDVYEELVNIVEKYDIDQNKLKLEITESAIFLDMNNNFKVLKSLHNYGFDLEIDDFGSGYSSLNLIKDIDFDVIKLDRVFLKETENQEKSKTIYNLMIDMAKKMGMKVISEGVENENQIDALKDMGCDVFQGYYFDKPISVQEFEKKYICKEAAER